MNPKTVFLFFLCMVLLPLFADTVWGQVGIGTLIPKATLDISATNIAAPSETDGLLIPRVSDFPLINPGADQHGMMLFLTTTVGANPPGFYYWDNTTTNWVNINTATGITTDRIEDADADTKIQVEESANEDKIRFDTAGTERLIIDANGDVGIGTSTIGAPLHIQRTTEDAILKLDAKSTSFEARVEFAKFNSSLSSSIGYQPGDASLRLRTNQNNDIVFEPNTSEKMRLKTTGNLGIGEINPQEKLHVVGNIRMVDGNQQTGYVMTSDANGTASWTVPSIPSIIIDADADTSIELIEDATNDSISFKVNNASLFSLKEGGIHTNFGGNNLFIGKNSGENADNTGVKENTGIGRKSLQALTTGIENTAVGRETLSFLTTGKSNVALGNGSSKEGVTTGDFNTTIGVLSMAYANSGSSNNTALGSLALNSVQGSNNTAVGESAGYNLGPTGVGSGNVFIGNNAGSGNQGSGNVFIGFGAGTTDSSYLTASETLLIDNGFADPLIYGEFDTELLRINGTLDINDEYTLPTADGTNGQVLTTNGSGSVSWETPANTTEILESGTAAVPANATGVSAVIVNFTNTYTTAPNVQISVESNSFGEFFLANIKYITTTQVEIHVMRVDSLGNPISNDVTVKWMAY